MELKVKIRVVFDADETQLMREMLSEVDSTSLPRKQFMDSLRRITLQTDRLSDVVSSS